MTAEYLYSTDTGAITTDTEDLLEDVRNEFRAALGQNINLDANTPQGTLVAAETIARGAVMRSNAEYANQINPDLSHGVFLDAICAFLGIGRGENRSTILRNVLLEGNSTVTIQAGSRVQAESGAVFSTIDEVTIGTTGTVLADLIAAEFGDIQVPLQSMTIIDGTVGWGAASVVVSTEVEPGSVAMKDGALKNSRNKRLFNLGIGATGAIMASVLKVANVVSAKVIENNTGTTGTHHGIDFTLPNAVWVCVAGEPIEAEVAAALYRAHHAAVPWDFGGPGQGIPVGTGVPVIDPFTGVQYLVKYTTAVEYDVYFSIVAKRGPASATAIDAIKNAVVSYSRGEVDGEIGFGVGEPISAFDVSGSIASALPGLYIKSVKLACVEKGSPPPPESEYVYEFDLPMWGFPTTSAGQVNVILEA